MIITPLQAHFFFFTLLRPEPTEPKLASSASLFFLKEKRKGRKGKCRGSESGRKDPITTGLLARRARGNVGRSEEGKDQDVLKCENSQRGRATSLAITYTGRKLDAGRAGTGWRTGPGIQVKKKKTRKLVTVSKKPTRHLRKLGHSFSSLESARTK